MRYLLILLTFLVFVGCKTTTPSNETAYIPPNTVITLGKGQQLITLFHEDFGQWIKENASKIHITSLTGIGAGDHGRDDYFVVVYDTVVPTVEKQ